MEEKTKSSWYLPSDVIAAMEAVYKEKRILKSHQVEMGLKLYLKEHEDLLKEVGLDIWK